MPLPSLRALLALALLSAAACDGRARGEVAAEFLIAAGDSTFWVRSGADGLSVRRSSLLLARIDGRFHEIYVADDDRSFYDAVLVGQRVYRRDLLTNDSTVLFDDPRVAGIARDYALAHPDERPLGPDDETSADPHTVASIEVELLDLFGRYLSFAHHLDVDIVNGEDTHRSRRGVLDVAAGGEVTLAVLLGADDARRVIASGRAAYEATVDSILAASGSGARRAASAISDFRFDTSSFALVDEAGGVAVSFFVPGTGTRSAGITLPLAPIPVATPAWWKAHAATVPAPSPEGERWALERYEVVARYDSSGESFTLAIRDGRAESVAGRFPAPAQRLYRLDHPPIDAATREALGRAFDEAALYSGESRTAQSSPRAATALPAAFIPPAHRK